MDFYKYYYHEAFEHIGPASGEINRTIMLAFVEKYGKDKLPAEIQVAYNEYMSEMSDTKQ